MKSSRLIAFEALHKIFTDNAYSNLTLENVLKDVKEDKSFISALVYGTVERKITLDYYIFKYLNSKPKPKILTILRLGAYQILFMEKVPDSAAVNESVKLTKEINQSYYGSLVNAVLHKIQQDNESVENIKDLSIKYSVPQNLINMWYKQYSKEKVDAFLPFVNSRPPVFAVPNRLYVDADELQCELMSEGIECETVGELVKINSPFDLNKLKSFENGLFHIQDMSSYECAKSLGVQKDDTVIDICSAPGGKTFTLAELMENSGTVYAYDLYEHRINQVVKGAKRLGLDNIVCGVNDALKYNSAIPLADKILCDVVCSGYGIIRRKPEIRYKELDSVKALPEIQLKILETASKYLKSGGTIVYSTCTLNKKENEAVTKAFLNDNKDFSITEEKTTFPSLEGGDGFYRAVMKKNEN